MIIEPGKPSGYVFAVLGITALIALFFGVAVTIVAEGIHGIGYTSTDPLLWGKTVALVSGALTFVIASVVGYRDYHFNPDAEKTSKETK